MSATRSYRGLVGDHASARYTRESVERALTHHLGAQGWSATDSGGYTAATGMGTLRLATLREAYIFVVGLADGRRIEEGRG